ncbi:MAG: flippase-like domain-containing protein [Woeseiaceae bacterium]|nr:flippase-like domain-containing protein [Woeseiaceae bacterium]
MLQSRLFAYSRYFSFLLLGVISIYALYRLATGDWSEVSSFWASRGEIIPLLILISVIDVALEGLAWAWVYHRFQIRVFDSVGTLAFLSGRAGLPLPAQLGRLIRPDAIVKQRRTPIANALKAEAVVFALNAISVVSLLGGLIVYQIFPAISPIAVLACIAASIFLGNTLTKMLTKTRLHLPLQFWWTWPTFFIILIMMAGWLAHGLALHFVVRDLPGEMTLWDSLFFAPGTAVLGVATGLPGGIGATEGLLGATLKVRSVPVEHLAIAVAAFRLVTFWMWIPIGWIAIAILRKLSPDPNDPIAENAL